VGVVLLTLQETVIEHSTAHRSCSITTITRAATRVPSISSSYSYWRTITVEEAVVTEVPITATIINCYSITNSNNSNQSSFNKIKILVMAMELVINE
jgi:hypothetical protein